MRRARAVSSTRRADGGVRRGKGRGRVAVDPAAVGATVVAVSSADDDYAAAAAAAAVAVGGDAAVSVVATRRRHRRWCRARKGFGGRLASATPASAEGDGFGAPRR